METDQAEGESSPAEEDLRGLLEKRGASSEKIARLLDDCFRIPGTKIRFGFDPILGLIPGGGETAASIIGAYIVADATRNGIPFSLIFKMGGNMLLNGLVGAIPGLGDVFSVWFKSNARNYRLMRAHLDTAEGQTSRGGWWPLLVVAGMLGAVFAINLTVWFLTWRSIYHLVTRIV